MSFYLNSKVNKWPVDMKEGFQLQNLKMRNSDNRLKLRNLNFKTFSLINSKNDMANFLDRYN